MEENNSNIIEKLQILDPVWDSLNLAATEAKFRDLLPDAQRLMGTDRVYLIELLTLIARAEALLSKIPEALETLKIAEKFLSNQEVVYPVSAKIRWLLERGRIYILQKTPSQARLLFAEALNLAITSGEDYYAVDVAQMMAMVEPQKVQQEWIVRAIGIAENSSSLRTKEWLGSLYTTLGWKRFDLRQYEKSLESFKTALSHFKVHGTKREIFVARWSTGKVLRAMGKTEEALSIQQALLAELGVDGLRDGRLYEEIAECLQTMKREKEAQLYFEFAYRELSKDEWVADNQPVMLKRMKSLGQVK